MYNLMKSCTKVYRSGGCQALPNEPCCQIEEENVLVWSIRKPDPNHNLDTKHLLTISFQEGLPLVQSGDWEEVCTPISGPPEICASATNLTGDSPFMLFSKEGVDRSALYRCRLPDRHFFSLDVDCEGQTSEGILGYLSTKRNSHSPRPLSRCYNTGSQTHFHWLAEQCPVHLPNIRHESVLGFVK